MTKYNAFVGKNTNSVSQPGADSAWMHFFSCSTRPQGCRSMSRIGVAGLCSDRVSFETQPKNRLQFDAMRVNLATEKESGLERRLCTTFSFPTATPRSFSARIHDTNKKSEPDGNTRSPAPQEGESKGNK